MCAPIALPYRAIRGRRRAGDFEGARYLRIDVRAGAHISLPSSGAIWPGGWPIAEQISRRFPLKQRRRKWPA